MLLLLDNFDSFTYNLADYLAQAGAECRVVRNDVPLSAITQHTYQAIVLSPGPATPEKAGCMMEVIAHYYQKIPILGICLGHQALGTFFGATLTTAARPMHGKISAMHCQPDALFNNIPVITSVVRYHSLVLKNISLPLETIALTSDNEVMAIRHSSLPIRGLQFHPEAFLTGCGLQMIKNWLTFIEPTIDIS